MDRGTARSVLRDVRTLYTLGTLSGLTDAELLERFLAREKKTPRTRSRPSFIATGPPSWAPATGCCRARTTRRTPSRPPSSCWRGGPRRSAGGNDWRAGCTAWPSGSPRTLDGAVRLRAAERRLMDLSRPEWERTEDRDDVIPLLDEELTLLPSRYRSALVACELEGKSRREAAGELGIPEGTLSTYLARGRKLLRERLRRRGVTLGVGPIAGTVRPLVESTIPERLMGPTVRVALTPPSVATAAVPSAVSSLAERVLKMMFLARLTLIVAALMAAAMGTTAVVMLIPPATAAARQAPVPHEPGPDDLPGRVVDRNGAGVAGVEIWAMDGPGWTPETVAKTTTDGEGRFVVPWPRARRGQPGAQNFALFARGRDGSIGWQRPVWYNSADGKRSEIELHAVGEVRGRLTDQDARPIAGVEVAPVLIMRIARRWDPAQRRPGDPVPDDDSGGRLVRARGNPSRRRDLCDDCGPCLRHADGPLGHEPGGNDRPRRPPGPDQGPAQAARHARSRAPAPFVAAPRGRSPTIPLRAGSSWFTLRTPKRTRTACSSSTVCRPADTWSKSTSIRTA